jgi:hypothetical protein
MKYKNTLSIIMSSDVTIPMAIVHNQQVTNFTLQNQLNYDIILEPNMDHSIQLEQTANSYSQFFYIKKVLLGSIDITELLHHDNICSVVDKESQNKIGDFIEDIGQNDRVLLQINSNFYSIIFKRIGLVCAG